MNGLMIAPEAIVAAAFRKEVVMFQDSLSEGHIYWGRFAAVVAAIAALAYLVPHL